MSDFLHNHLENIKRDFGLAPGIENKEKTNKIANERKNDVATIEDYHPGLPKIPIDKITAQYTEEILAPKNLKTN